MTEPVVVWDGAELGATVVRALPPLATDDPAARFYPLPDVALLRVVGPAPEHPCVRLDPAEPVASPAPDLLRLTGFTLDQHRGGGTVALNGATTDYESPFDEQGWRLLKLKAGQVVGGYSGGPALNTRTGRVCAVVESTRGERDDLGGFAVPVAGFLDQLEGLRDRNEAVHRSSDRWDRAVEEERGQLRVRQGARDRLPLSPPRADLDWGPDDPPSDLLRPRYGVVPLVGRAELLDQLMLWREHRDRFRVVVLGAAGGFGKTRAAVETAVQADRAGWLSGLLAGHDLQHRPDEALDDLADWPTRLLVVVDYAETRPDLVAGLLARLLRRRDRPPARVVLAVRQLATRRQLEELFAAGDAAEELTAAIRRSEMVRLDTGEHELDRADLFDQAVSAFAARLGGTRPAGPAPLAALRQEHFQRPLFVLAAALLVASDPEIDLAALGADELVAEVLDRHEASYWRRLNDRLGTGLHDDDRRRLVAVAALLGAETENEAVRLVRLVPGFADAGDERARTVARWLAGLYGSGGLDTRPALTPIEPDLLAEALVARELTVRPELLGAALDGASDHQLARALLVLGRAATGRDELAEVARSALDDRLEAMVRRFVAQVPWDLELLAALRLVLRTVRPARGAVLALNELPDQSLALTPLAADLGGLAVAALRGLAQDDPDRYLPGLAAAVNNLALWLGELGRPTDALVAVEEAVTHYRALARANPDRYLPDLAMALDNLSETLSDLGRGTEAAQQLAHALEDHHQDRWATGVLLLVRAEAQRRDHRLAAALQDAWAAMERLEAAGDMPRRGLARTLLRSLRGADAEAFDRAWDELLGTGLPSWLRQVARDPELEHQVLEWVGGPSLDDSRAMLLARRDALLTDAEAAIEHLIDADPDSRELPRHLALLQAARSDGVEAAYDARRALLDREALERQLDTWLGTPDWDGSRTTLERHAETLLTAEAERLLTDAVAEAGDPPDLVVQVGLLALSRSDGIEAAYGLLVDDQRLRAEARQAGDGDPARALALARLLAGQRPDDGDAQLDHALAALGAGRAEEAERAVARCAEALAWWERTARARRLAQLAAQRPELAEGLERLRVALLAPAGLVPGDPDGDRPPTAAS